MAKMFYTMDETKAALGKNEEEIKQFAREGRLREFRDGPRLMFKADQVETLKSELGGGGGASDQVELAGPGGESGAPIGLVDSRGASSSGSAIALADSSTGNVPLSKDDTALAADLSGSMGGVPSPGRGGSTMGGKAATSTGVTVFGTEEGVERADPGAQTAISQSISDNASLESVGSGSGLLDLTRESDDTSLGALALDQTGPGTPSPKRRAATPGETSAATLAGGEEPVVVRTPAAGQPVYREAVDEMAPAFAGAAAAACIAMLLGAYVLMAAVSGYKPDFVVSLAQQGPLLLAAYGLGLAVVLFIVGLFVGKAVSR